MTTMAATRRHDGLSTGQRLGLGSAMFAAGVALEWVLDPQRGSAGTVVRPVAFAACVGTSLLGVVLMAQAVHAGSGMAGRKGGRTGRRLLLAGIILVALGSATILVTGLVSGEPLALAFVPWALGLLVMSVGSVVLGVACRRDRAFGAAMALAGVAAFAALAIPLDPWHDVSLMTACLGWCLAGLALRR